MERMRLMKTLEKAWKTVVDLRKALVVLPLVLLLAQIAGAGVIYQGETGVQSYLAKDGIKTMSVNIRFSVYDNILSDFVSPPGTQRYIYEYIVENTTASQVAVDLFSVVAGPSAGIAAIGTAIYAAGIDATGTITTVPTVKQSADFSFNKQTPLDIGENSYVLMFTSNNSYRTDGKAVITGGSDGSIPKPDSTTPEPVTVLTFGLGALAIIRRKKMSR
jgi:hypothetical protein